MRIEQLENNEIVKQIVNDIISDQTFKNKCKLNFEQIFEDGKIDKDDVPLIINLILTIYQNHTKINISKIHLKPVFMLLISRLIEEFKGESELDQNLILLLIEPQIDLLLMSLNVNCSKWFRKLCCCCFDKPEDKEEKETNVLKTMKLNKIEKQKMVLKSEAAKPESVELDILPNV